MRNLIKLIYLGFFAMAMMIAIPMDTFEYDQPDTVRGLYVDDDVGIVQNDYIITFEFVDVENPEMGIIPKLETTVPKLANEGMTVDHIIKGPNNNIVILNNYEIPNLTYNKELIVYGEINRIT